MIPAKYTCDGQDTSPPLKIEEVPSETKSLVLIVDDPDAPMGCWVHWIICNINPAISLIEEGTIPQGGVELVNNFNKTAYGGPCPPSGTHRYFFKLYALDKTLELDASSGKAEIEKAMTDSILASAELIGLYQRQ